jgi:large subunit ribosomal protein L32
VEIPPGSRRAAIGNAKAKVMAVPKRRTSHARSGKRRSHQHLTPLQICEQPVLPHRVCPNCGYYQDREVVPEKEEKK